MVLSGAWRIFWDVKQLISLVQNRSTKLLKSWPVEAS